MEVVEAVILVLLLLFAGKSNPHVKVKRLSEVFLIAAGLDVVVIQIWIVPSSKSKGADKSHPEIVGVAAGHVLVAVPILLQTGLVCGHTRGAFRTLGIALGIAQMLVLCSRRERIAADETVTTAISAGTCLDFLGPAARAGLVRPSKLARFGMCLCGVVARVSLPALARAGGLIAGWALLDMHRAWVANRLAKAVLIGDEMLHRLLLMVLLVVAGRACVLEGTALVIDSPHRRRRH